MSEQRVVITVHRHIQALPAVAQLESAGIDTAVVPERTPISRAANLLVEPPVVRSLPGVSANRLVMVAEDRYEQARALLIEAGLLSERDQPWL
jgi:hypothetical protein